MSNARARAIGVTQIILCPLIAINFGCTPPGELDVRQILTTPSWRWSVQQCNTIMVESTSSNVFHTGVSTYAYVIPLLPRVIVAHCRKSQQVEHWSNAEFVENVDRQANSCLGFYYDARTGGFFDARGNEVKTVQQAQRLTFAVFLDNAAPPDNMANPEFQGPRLNWTMSSQAWHSPDITQIESNVYLENQKKESIKATRVSGRKQAELVGEEQLTVGFDVTNDVLHFLQTSTDIYLVVRDLDDGIRVKTDLSNWVNSL
jgi:hypothetical protein